MSTVLICAQILTEMQLPFSIDWKPVIQFMIFTGLNTPPNFIWYLPHYPSCDIGINNIYRQSYLESTFPSNKLVPSNAAINAASQNNEKELDREQKTSEILESKLSKRNTFAKFALDQTLGAGVNNVIFLLAFGGLSGKTWDQSVQSVHNEFWPLIFAGWKLWPLVSFFNFAIIKSVEMRNLVGCLAGMGWGIYLSLSRG